MVFVHPYIILPISAEVSAKSARQKTIIPKTSETSVRSIKPDVKDISARIYVMVRNTNARKNANMTHENASRSIFIAASFLLKVHALVYPRLLRIFPDSIISLVIGCFALKNLYTNEVMP